MRVFFCVVPAFVVLIGGALIAMLLIDSTATEAITISGACSIAMFVLGWQVTDPKKERERDEAAQKGQQ